MNNPGETDNAKSLQECFCTYVHALDECAVARLAMDLAHARSIVGDNDAPASEQAKARATIACKSQLAALYNANTKARVAEIELLVVARRGETCRTKTGESH